MSRSHNTSDSMSASCERRNGSSRVRRVARSVLVFSAVAIVASLTSPASATPTAYPPHITAPALLDTARTALSSDMRPSGDDHAAAVPAVEHELLRRSESEEAPPKDRARSTTSEDEDEESGKTTSAGDDEESKTSSGSRRQTTTARDESESRTTGSATTSTGRGTTTADATPSPFPSPFDNALDSDFTAKGGDDSCPKFIFNLLSDATFQRCYPVSMMIETSSSFFNAQKKLLDIVRVLDRACNNVDVDFCTNWLNDAARNLKASENCGQEIDTPNLPSTAPIMQAYRGLRAYNMLYTATCLQDPDADMYCYATAATNTTSPSDNYLYWMPLGLNLPGSSVPSCNQCVTETMGIYHTASADRSQLIADTYEAAALQINTICGPNFVNPTLPPPDTSFGLELLPSHLKVLVGICVGIAFNFVL